MVSRKARKEGLAIASRMVRVQSKYFDWIHPTHKVRRDIRNLSSLRSLREPFHGIISRKDNLHFVLPPRFSHSWISWTRPSRAEFPSSTVKTRTRPGLPGSHIDMCHLYNNPRHGRFLFLNGRTPFCSDHTDL